MPADSSKSSSVAPKTTTPSSAAARAASLRRSTTCSPTTSAPATAASATVTSSWRPSAKRAAGATPITANRTFRSSTLTTPPSSACGCRRTRRFSPASSEQRRRPVRPRQAGRSQHMDEKLRFGLIGCGGQGRYLSEALSLTKQADFAACADLDLERAATAAQQCGYRETFGSAAEMLSNTDLDAVIVATIHDQLQPCGLAVVEAGKHLFIEKPMALTAADGQRLVDAARAKNVKVMVGYTLPFLSTRRKLRQLLDEGAVGELAHVFAGQLIGGMGGWLGQPEHGGGPLFYIGTHVLYEVLDVVRRKAERVYAEVTLTDAGVDRECLFTVRFEGGVVAQIATSQRLGGRYGWIDVLGSAGRVRSEWESPDVFVQSTAISAYRQETLIRVPDESVGPKVALGDKASVTGFKYVRAWAEEFADFLAAIREDRDPAVTGEDGVRVLEITDAVFESGRTGLPVAL
ncbi:MAG: hypothetical protein COZ06_12635 [Armatimonadetes bacterium CG_4_10_14_3_um_filter_66_18]|nr:MAG: hypothetical protein COZ06_12635 [Armatimonadetes bacterium CG_4_10_14_3_um_filter_66_18]PJB73546.1 MAG: hypothetical protein CO096_05830 [Armatimonadetes bacterium CG_4_9_14_3_um_filter_66_14]